MAEEFSPIRGKVARILNSRELALNIGAKHGVEVGMLFDVLDPKGESIRDPDTQKVIGSIPRPKIRVRITAVQDTLSVASTYRLKKKNRGGVGSGGLFSGGALASVLMAPDWVDVPETLKTTEATWDDLDESQSFVKTGDPVQQVREGA